MLTSESLGSFSFRKSFDLLISAVVCFHTIIYHHGIDLRKVFFCPILLGQSCRHRKGL